MYSSLYKRNRTGAVEEEPYILVSIAKSVSPAAIDDNDKAEKADWHRYVITQGENQIVGHRRGTLESVRVDVGFLVTQLNERRSGKNPRSAAASQSQKKAAAKA